MKQNFEILINGKHHQVDVDPDMPLLWVVRDIIGLKGTKYGCGKAACGACTLHIDGDAVRSCSYPVKLVKDKEVTTIEGLSTGDSLHPVQEAWIDLVVPQCGYCQPGFMMTAAALLAKNNAPTDEDIDNSISNICRCGTHFRIRKAIHKASSILNSKSVTNDS